MVPGMLLVPVLPISDTAGRGGGMCVFLGVFAWRTGTEGLACWERKKGEGRVD